MAFPTQGTKPYNALLEAEILRLVAERAPLPGEGPNPMTGWFHTSGYEAVGDGTTDVSANFAALIADIDATDGGTIFIDQPGEFMVNNLTLAKSNVTIVMHGGAVLKKNADGPVLTWGSSGFTKFEALGLRIDGNGAAFDGGGLVIDVNTAFPRLSGGAITDTESYPLEFTGPTAGHSARVSDMVLYPSSPSVAAIKLPDDTGFAPNRQFVNIHAPGVDLFEDAGSQDSKFTSCTAHNVAFSGSTNPAKLFLTDVRLASGGDPITLLGDQSIFVDCAFAGDVTIDGDSNFCVIADSVFAGDLTIDTGAQATVVGPNSIAGTYTDNGTATLTTAYDPDLTWNNVSFQNSWVDYGSGYQTVQYRKIGDVVSLRGCMKSGSSSVPAFALPGGHVPPSLIAFQAPASDTNGLGRVYVEIANNGTVVFYSYADGGDNTFVCLDGISFSVT